MAWLVVVVGPNKQVEDYDRAKSLKMEIDVLRGEIDAKLEPYLDLAGRSEPACQPASHRQPGPRSSMSWQEEDQPSMHGCST